MPHRHDGEPAQGVVFRIHGDDVGQVVGALHPVAALSPVHRVAKAFPVFRALAQGAHPVGDIREAFGEIPGAGLAQSQSHGEQRIAVQARAQDVAAPPVLVQLLFQVGR